MNQVQVNKIRGKNLEESMYPSKNKASTNINKFFGNKINTVVYTIKGKEDEMLENYPIINALNYIYKDGTEKVKVADQREEAYAKKVRFENNNKDTITKFYIRRNSRGKLFNPIGLYDEIRHNKMRYTNEEHKYMEVNKKSFELYLEFLRTKNLSYLNNAERESI